MHGFDFHVGGIEDGILAALAPLKVGQPDGYVKTLDTYSGQLDSDQLKRALGDITPTMPTMLVAYGDGQDVLDPATAPVMGLPRFFRHDCTFTVICLSDDARSEKARRRGSVSGVGTYRMIADAQVKLGGLRFKAIEGSESLLLNGEPLRYDGVEYLTRLPGLTAYAVHFATYFRYAEPDRSVQGPLVQELVLTIEPTNVATNEPNLPGVSLR
jgi:hypothetical protein